MLRRDDSDTSRPTPTPTYPQAPTRALLSAFDVRQLRTMIKRRSWAPTLGSDDRDPRHRAHLLERAERVARQRRDAIRRQIDLHQTARQRQRRRHATQTIVPRKLETKEG